MNHFKRFPYSSLIDMICADPVLTAGFCFTPVRLSSVILLYSFLQVMFRFIFLVPLLCALPRPLCHALSLLTPVTR